ncbi:FIMAH domain-containing protein [Cohnella silvisoli]|uniref:FIMAH domain-containing protein n=1 Tax=Cohnella silvisoli TaxID=2873699 RepID=A0ABV1L0D6_9BACL|nr:hypothetical protein [Cohnella silvisoli]MCD9025105.1 hypothetical protein [Cohnella silvisoli]
MNNYLEMMRRFEGTDEAQADKYLKGFNAKLDQLKKDQLISDGVYSTLKEGVYYLIGNLAQNKAVEASSVEASSPKYVPAKAVDGFQQQDGRASIRTIVRSRSISVKRRRWTRKQSIGKPIYNRRYERAG